MNMPLPDKYVKARDEAYRFLAAIAELDKRYQLEGERAVNLQISGSKEAGTVKRASLDLSRALSEMRKP